MAYKMDSIFIVNNWKNILKDSTNLIISKEEIKEYLERHIKKYKTKGMPIDKFKTSTIDHIERIVGLVKKYS